VTSSTPSTAGDRLWRRLSGLLLLGIAGVMFATLLDYGMSGDEGVQHRYGRKLLRWYASLGADPKAAEAGDISMYGGLFEILAESAAAVSPLDPFETRHGMNVVFALLAFGAAYSIAARLGGGAAGFFAVLFLALTPPFYGHAFNNPKDIPFAGTFAAAAAMILAASEGGARARRAIVAAGAMIGLVAAVRVAGLVLFGYAALLWGATWWMCASADGERPPRRAVGRLVGSWLLALGVGWSVMIAFWPWALADPLRNPFRAWQAFSQFWGDAVLFFEGRFVLSSEVSRFYLPKWFALTLPELYPVAFVLGALALARRLRRPLDGAARLRVVQILWVAALALLPVAWVVAMRTPLYDGLRHFLFVMPLLAVLAGVAFAAYLRSSRGWLDAGFAGGAIGILCVVTLVDMIELHPYQTVYFNRTVAGGLVRAVSNYETDYWCLSYKEGDEWLMKRYARATCRDKIRVAGHSTQLQTAYYLRRTEQARRLFKPVGVGADPHFVLATTRFGDHRQTPGRLVHVVERQRASLLYVFEVKEPPCDERPLVTLASNDR
jgi:hypothetical protein